jgi:hypothetical protein
MEFAMSRAKPLVLAAALLPLLAGPIVSHAGPTAAMDACVDAFLATGSLKDRKVVVRKDLDSMTRPLAASGLYRIEVVAKNKDSGKQIARSVCHVNSSGEIVALNGRGITASTPSPLLSSR